MKKQLLLVLLCLGLSISANAQNQGTTEAVPIANGCGTEDSKLSQYAAAAANPIDALITSPEFELLLALPEGITALPDTLKKQMLVSAVAMAFLSDEAIEELIEEQIKVCNVHDKAYYHGVPKGTADGEFKDKAPIKGTAVILAQETSQAAYDAAQEERRKSEELQPIWEEENQACLNSEEYKVIEKDMKGENQTYMNTVNDNTVSKEEARAMRRKKFEAGYEAAMSLLNRLAR